MYLLLGICCFIGYFGGDYVTAWILAGGLCILAEAISELTDDVKICMRDRDKTLKDCADKIGTSITKSSINSRFGFGGGITCTDFNDPNYIDTDNVKPV